jgi:hypothetical protein
MPDWIQVRHAIEVLAGRKAKPLRAPPVASTPAPLAAAPTAPVEELRDFKWD